MALARGTSLGIGAGAILGAAPWTPLTPGNLLAWFKADVGTTDAGGGALSAWADQSGNGHNLAQATGAARPTIQATGWNGAQPTISFDGTNDFLSNTSGLSSYLNGTNKNVSMLVTARLADNAAATFQFLAAWRDDPGLSSVVMFDASLTAGKYVNEFRNNSVNVAGTLGMQDRFSRYAFIAGGGSASSYIDSVLDVNGGSFSTTAAGQNSFLLGTSHLGTNYWKGLISEIAIYSALLNGTDVANYLTYSLAKWGGLGGPLVMGVSAISTDTNATGATATVPGTAATNDVIVAHVTITNENGAASSVSPPAGEGWSIIASTSDSAGTDCTCVIYWKRWGTGSTDNTSVAFTGTSGNMRLVLTRLRGCKTSGNPYTDATGANGGGAGTGTTLTAPTANGGSQKRVLRFYSGSATSATITANGMAATYGGASYGFTAGVDGACAAGDAMLDSNPTGTATATSSATLANGWAAITVSFTAT